MNTDELKQLLSRIELHNKMEEVPYSILPMMYDRISSKELLHSEIIASLLDPNEKHGLGEVPLQCFLDKIDCKDFGELSKTIVELEKGVEDMRRIDILLTNGNKAIIIENKLNDAVDQPNQLKDYLNSITNKKLDVLKIVYLPLYEYKSAKEKVDNVLNLYPKDLIDWLSSCNSDTCNDYALLLKYMNQTNINFMEAKALQQAELSAEELTKLIDIANIITSESWNAARFEPIIVAVKTAFPKEELKSSVSKNILNIWFGECYKYWIDVRAQYHSYDLYVVDKEDENAAIPAEVMVKSYKFDSIEKGYRYLKIKNKDYPFPDLSNIKNKELIDEIINLLKTSKK